MTTKASLMESLKVVYGQTRLLMDSKGMKSVFDLLYMEDGQYQSMDIVQTTLLVKGLRSTKLELETAVNVAEKLFLVLSK